MDQVKRLYDMKRMNKQIHLDEELSEWDGNIDGMRLIQQMTINTSTLNKQRELPQAAQQHTKLRRAEDYRPQQQTVPQQTPFPLQQQPAQVYGRSVAHQPVQYAQPFGILYGVQPPAPLQPAKFETNPKHKLKPRDSKPSADDEYVMRKKKEPESHYAEEYVKKNPTPIDASELESRLKKQAAPINIEDLERQLKSQPKPLDAEELERSMASRK